MSDVVDTHRLRLITCCLDVAGKISQGDCVRQAADEIGALRAKNERLEELLSCALDEREGENGVLVGNTKHWSVLARHALQGTTP
ncbi:MAG: hypothetical protein AAGB23_05425 [Pseudomonadota bacterium]